MCISVTESCCLTLKATEMDGAAIKATWSPTLCPQLIEALYFKKGSALVNDILNILALFYFVLQRSEMVEITSMPQ